MTSSISRFCRPLLPSLLLALVLLPAWGQDPGGQAEPFASHRPGGADSDPLQYPRDLSGRSVKTPRVRALHGRTLEGSSGWLMDNDPWLAYQRGRDMCLREFSAAEGAFGEAGKLRGKTLDDGATVMGNSGHVNGCAVCHNNPWRDMGAGITIPKNAGSGRNTPHLFGAGQIEMIGQEIRRQLLAQADTDGNGWVSWVEAGRAGTARVSTGTGAELDFGRFEDDDQDGRPDLNPVVYVWYVDHQGRRIPWARDGKSPEAAGFNFEVQVFGHGQRDQFGHGGLSSTLRGVASNALDMHAGLSPHDPTTNQEPNHDGLAGISLAGAQQFYTGFTRDLGQVCDPPGVSIDDPDRDGVVEEISEGDLDLLEWFLLNHPAPAQAATDPISERGRAIFNTVGCTACHTPDWELPHDRRFFDLSVRDRDGSLEGQIRPVQPGAPLLVRGIFSDFRHHDLGEAFYELQYDGSPMRAFRTSPLWGVASSAPYAHDGACLNLDQVIRRHGGEAESTTERYRRLSARDRRALLDFLGTLVLYSTETLATDVDGDGRVSAHFVVAGQDTGREVFNPEWLFRHPGRIEGFVEAPGTGARVFSRALTNLEQAYGMRLPGLCDLDGDGFVDLLGPIGRPVTGSP